MENRGEGEGGLSLKNKLSMQKKYFFSSGRFYCTVRPVRRGNGVGGGVPTWSAIPVVVVLLGKSFVMFVFLVFEKIEQ